MSEVNKSIVTTVKTGKVLFGTENAIRTAKTGRAKLIIVASNCPQKTREDVEYYCRLSKIPITIHNGTSMELGAICGKPFMISALTVREPGDSDILKLTEAANV